MDTPDTKAQHLERLRTMHGHKRGSGGSPNLWPSNERAASELQFAAAFLGIGASSIAEILGHPHPYVARHWTSKRIKRTPSAFYLLRLNHLILRHAKQPFAIDARKRIIFWGQNLYTLKHDPMYYKDEMGQERILASYWKEVFDKTD